MAFQQQQQWTVEYTVPEDGSRVVEEYLWNAGRMNTRDKLTYSNGSIQRDRTYSYAFHEVAFGDPTELVIDEKSAISTWHVDVDCREGSENGGKCINLTNNLDQRNGSAAVSHYAILFKTKDDAVAFLRFVRN